MARYMKLKTIYSEVEIRVEPKIPVQFWSYIIIHCLETYIYEAWCWVFKRKPITVAKYKGAGCYLITKQIPGIRGICSEFRLEVFKLDCPKIYQQGGSLGQTFFPAAINDSCHHCNRLIVVTTRDCSILDDN